MAVNDLSWGPLGDPSSEKIQEWVNLPWGKFRHMVRGAGYKGGMIDGDRFKYVDYRALCGSERLRIPRNLVR